MLEHAKTILRSYSEILFFNGVWQGAAILLITLLNPNVAAAGALSMLAAFAFARLIRMDRDFLKSGFYMYNPLLVGLAVGYLFKLTPLTAFFVVAAGVLTLVLTIMLNHMFSSLFHVPILSLPFAIVASVVHLASGNFAGLFVAGLYTHGSVLSAWTLPFWAAGFFKSLGAIFFLPYVLPGVLIAALILCNSRILFMLAVAGYYCGTLITGLLIGSYEIAFSDMMHFNYILIAMALGGVFLVPSLRSYTVALVAVAAATVFLKSMQVFWAWYGIPGFTVPFNVITISFVYVLGVVQFPLRPRLIRATPEQTLDEHIADTRRHTGTLRAIQLPFAGRWTVWQGFDGAWTHQGNWRHAFDFIITGSDGQSGHGSGARLEEYYAWHKSVMAPITGRVVKVISTLPDNPVGHVDKANPWGNLVLIWDERGFYVEISHFARDTIRVREGQWVTAGALLGKCGNSGYSPQPHIHVQVQATPEPGAATLPFSFADFTAGVRFCANGLPAEGQCVEPLPADACLDARMSFMLDDEFRYTVTRGGRDAGEWGFCVKMALDGTFYFDSGRGRLYFTKLRGAYLAHRVDGADPLLCGLFLSLPRMPLAFRPGLDWSDHLPMSIAASGPRRELVRFFSAFAPSLARMDCVYRFESKTTIAGAVSSKILGVNRTTLVELEGVRGFGFIQFDNVQMRRKENETKCALDASVVDSVFSGFGQTGRQDRRHAVHRAH